MFGAILDGSEDHLSAIFVVRAKTDIEGFILKNAGIGILQRYSPDVNWTAHDLAILNMRYAAISINDIKNNIGRGYLYNIIVDNCFYGLNTNDAYGLEIKNCLVTNCFSAFSGFNHVYFILMYSLSC